MYGGREGYIRRERRRHKEEGKEGKGAIEGVSDVISGERDK